MPTLTPTYEDGARSVPREMTRPDPARQFPEGDVRARVREAVAQVERQEDEHLGWAQDMRTKMIGMQVSSGAMTAVAARAEEVVAHIKGWFS